MPAPRIACGTQKGRYIVNLSLAIFHELTLVGNCELVFADGQDGLEYEVRVMQDAAGGHRATFGNLLSERGQPPSNTLAPNAATTVRLRKAAGSYSLTAHWPREDG